MAMTPTLPDGQFTFFSYRFCVSVVSRFFYVLFKPISSRSHGSRHRRRFCTQQPRPRTVRPAATEEWTPQEANFGYVIFPFISLALTRNIIIRPAPGPRESGGQQLAKTQNKRPPSRTFLWRSFSFSALRSPVRGENQKRGRENSLVISSV